jgi:hypothetical protein
LRHTARDCLAEIFPIDLRGEQMRVVWLLAVLWLTPFLFFGWRAWLIWPSKQERQRQREVSKLYDYHFGRQNHGTKSELILLPRGSRKTSTTDNDLWFRIGIIGLEILSILLAIFVLFAYE